MTRSADGARSPTGIVPRKQKSEEKGKEARVTKCDFDDDDDDNEKKTQIPCSNGPSPCSVKNALDVESRWFPSF